MPGNRPASNEFSFPRYARLTISTAKTAKKSGCKLIGITDSFSSPLANLSDLLFALNVESFHITTSYVAVNTLCDILLNALLVSDHGKYMNKGKRIEEGFKNMDIFESM